MISVARGAKAWLLASGAALLTGCGGGGSSTAPVVVASGGVAGAIIAGPDVAITLPGTRTALTSAASAGTAGWNQVTGPSTVAFQDASSTTTNVAKDQAETSALGLRLADAAGKASDFASIHRIYSNYDNRQPGLSILPPETFVRGASGNVIFNGSYPIVRALGPDSSLQTIYAALRSDMATQEAAIGRRFSLAVNESGSRLWIPADRNPLDIWGKDLRVIAAMQARGLVET